MIEYLDSIEAYLNVITAFASCRNGELERLFLDAIQFAMLCRVFKIDDCCSLTATPLDKKAACDNLNKLAKSAGNIGRSDVSNTESVSLKYEPYYSRDLNPPEQRENQLA
jgi:hypothetical protein